MSTLIPWGPRFVDPFGLAFGPRYGRTRRPSESAWYVPAADVERDGDDAVVRLELPGVDDVKVEVVGDRLVVAGERRDERAGTGFRETRRGSFRRSFSLPQHVGPEAVTASYDAGVLTVRVVGVHVAPETHTIAIDGAPEKAAEPSAPESTENAENAENTSENTENTSENTESTGGEQAA